ncbi:MAG: hypothetical protein JST68_10865 [Bacteroidetes bacterium]|nr:hypothetical protein [Bacteroidota bacterium]
MKNRLGLLLILAFVASGIGCKKNVDFKNSPDYQGAPTDFFMPLQVGKYAIYRLDSLNFYYYGQLDTTTSYLAKDSVEKSFTDGSGKTAWLVTRYLSDTLGSYWYSSKTYTVSPSSLQVAVTEDNLRYIKLVAPVDFGTVWNGNAALPYEPFKDFFDFSDDSHLNLDNWSYTYQNVGLPYAVGSKKYDTTVTMLAVNDSVNVPIKDPKTFASRTYWWETYAKSVGLVYRHTEMWEYQPPTPDGTQSGYKIGFVVTMKLQSHN